MKWIIGGVLLYLFLNSQSSSATSAPGLTNQNVNPSTPLGFAQRIAQIPNQILYDITGSPTRADNNSPALGNPATNPVYPSFVGMPGGGGCGMFVKNPNGTISGGVC